MCKICDDAMDAVTDRGEGATAHAWDRIEAAIKSWRTTLPDDTDFEGVMEESLAWADHMAMSASQ